MSAVGNEKNFSIVSDKIAPQTTIRVWDDGVIV